MTTRLRGHRARSLFLPSLFAVLAAASVIIAPRRASCSLLNAGVEAGAVKRTADDPDNLKWGLGWGAHAELGMLPMLNLGPYYLHYELPLDNAPSNSNDAAFNVLGLRARLLLPIPDSNFKPYAYVGLGYTWLTYPGALPQTFAQPAAVAPGVTGNTSGHFLEIPIGVGLAYQIASIFHLSADVAYRTGEAFGGAAYDDAPARAQPKSGWSVMLGAALDL